jgi:hypothetical protein
VVQEVQPAGQPQPLVIGMRMGAGLSFSRIYSKLLDLKQI